MDFKKYKTSKYWIKFFIMIIAVCIMGVAVSILNFTKAGPDPCSSLNMGMASLLGMSFGNYQLLINTVIFIIVIIADRKLIGAGTFGNMILVGYVADLTTWFIHDVLGFTATPNMFVRIVLLVVAITIFLIAASVYMNCRLGTAPYDALSFLIHKQIVKVSGHDIQFRIVRIAYDGVVTITALLIGGSAGIVTICMVFLLGPCIDAIGSIMHNHIDLFKEDYQ